MKIHRYFCCLLLLLPWLTQAGDSADFAAASRSQQILLLQQWATAPQASRLPLLEALHNESVVIDQNKQPFDQRNDSLSPLDNAQKPDGEVKKLPINNRLRVEIASTFASHQLVSDNPALRMQAASQLASNGVAEQLPLIEQRLSLEKDKDVHQALLMAAARLNLNQTDIPTRLAAVKLLGESTDPAIQASLQRLTEQANEPDTGIRAAASQSLQQIKSRLMWGDWLGQAFTGLSLGSILLLAALGLAITYGLLGVINMAHGEMLMLGAYVTWLMQNLLQQFAPEWLGWYPILALPAAFLVTALIGMALERTIIRHLYGRPLETLLATWGISLMLIQMTRMLFGAQNLEVANPGWLSGGLQLLPNLVLPYNRIAVILFAFMVLILTWLLLNKTRLGLSVRAVTQNRAMADCCGVPTGRVDMLAFGLGSGIAGLGGVALSQLGNVGPELGQGYIIDSFLVVVVGGVGQLAGTVVAAFGLGILNKVLEPEMGAVMGKILILLLIILFIQRRPQGLFALKGRGID